MNTPDNFSEITTDNTRSIQVGELRVTSLRDSVVNFPVEILTGLSKYDFEHLLEKRNNAEAPQISINAFLVETAKEKVLIDTGVGGEEGQSSGRLLSELNALGVHSDDITHVLFTHLHADHAGGAVTLEGDPVFANAELIAHHAEQKYWFGGVVPDRGEAVLEQYKLAQRLLPIVDQFHWVSEEEILPGLTLVELPGHTPGHSGYRIQSGQESLLIWGDIVHQPKFQLANTSYGVAWDSNPTDAICTRDQVLRDAAYSGELIAGMHTDLPFFAKVQRISPTQFDLKHIVHLESEI